MSANKLMIERISTVRVIIRIVGRKVHNEPHFDSAQY
jgi:hypothetical protein